jgi:hypothetical protein
MSDRLDPRNFFSDNQLFRIGEAFADEFDTFGYPRLR